MNDACLICSRALLDHETGRYACLICQDRGIAWLRAMPALYAQLGDLLQPGAGRGEGRVSGSKAAPLPCSANALNLRARGGLVTILASWEDAVRDELGYSPAVFRGDYEQTLAGVVGFLVGNAPWIWGSFPAVDELHDELRRLHGQAQAVTGGEKPPIKVPVLCPCGNTLKITLDSPGERCRACDTQYGHTELMHLPLGTRRAA